MENLYALIMAGGGGTRLWPLSRQDRPKQMLTLVEDRTMFQVSVDRLAPLLAPDHIFVITGRGQVEALRASMPDLPAENFIVEPFGQDTGPAVGLGVLHIQRRAPRAIIAVLTADQHIAEKEKFRRVLAAAGELAGQGYIVTLGITPGFPATGYGYIKRGAALAQAGEFAAFHAAAFTEKPDLPTAGQFLAGGLHTWNSGMFIFRAEQLLAEYARQQPEMDAILRPIGAALGTPAYQETLDRLWPQIPKKSIDYAIMEHADRLAVIPVEMGWSDIGSWATLYDVLSDGQPEGTVVRGHGQGHVQLDTRGTLIISDRRVITIGVEDLVIVDTGDVLLVCRRDRSQEVKKVIDQLKAAGDVAHL